MKINISNHSYKEIVLTDEIIEAINKKIEEENIRIDEQSNVDLEILRDFVMTI